MRLTQNQIDAIKNATAQTFGLGTQVWLFGSRVDDRQRGGDINLLLRPAATRNNFWLESKIRVLGDLKERLSEQKIDVALEAPDDERPIVRLAHKMGVEL